MDDPLGDPIGQRAQLRGLGLLVAAGTADQQVRRVDPALAEPLAVVGVDGANGRSNLLGGLEDGRRELGTGVAINVVAPESAASDLRAALAANVRA